MPFSLQEILSRQYATNIEARALIHLDQCPTSFKV